MEEVTNITREEVLSLIEEFPVTPLKNRLIITVNMTNPNSQLSLEDVSFSETQYVLAVGSHCHEIQEGDKVLLDIEAMMKYEYVDTNTDEKVGRILIKPIVVGNRTFGLITDRFVEAIDYRDEDN